MKAVTPKKKLGQHFLNDLNIAEKITDQPFINHGKNVLEIGVQERNKSIIREVDEEISIRKGKFGAYVYYKTKQMKKPKFCGLGKQNIDDFMKDFKTPQDLKDWATEFKPKKFSRGKKF